MIVREAVLAFRRGGQAFSVIGFFGMTLAIFAFGMGPVMFASMLHHLLVIAVLLSSLLALPALFERDAEDGSLEQMLLVPVALEWLVLGKMLSYWLSCLLPATLLACLALIAHGDAQTPLFSPCVAIFLLSFILASVSVFAAALTVGIRRAHLTQALIMLPLYVPGLVFAASPEQSVALLILISIALFSIPLSCVMASALIRLAVR